MAAVATAAANVANPNQTATFALRKQKWCTPAQLGCLKIGLLPADKFPSPGQYPASKAAKPFVARANRPDLDPKRSHRLRLDRYDEIDFDNLREQMVKEGLWLL